MSGLRITGGVLKGRRIEVPKGDFEIRPAMDRMRESLFSILGPLDGLSFLDLFAGSGIIALESASRGATPVHCVERDRDKLGLLIKNVSLSKERIQCHCVPVERFILRSEISFDIIFCDPPFPYAHKADIIRSINDTGILNPGGRLLIHFPAEEILPDELGALKKYDERAYGRSLVRFYSFEEDDPPEQRPQDYSTLGET
jgi:16S rRNA (guanine(966)-N(2))-methyltransferase RsmD